MTISEMLENDCIDLDAIEERSLRSDYWSSCFDFLSEVEDKEYEKLSIKQKEWVDKIIIDMIEYTA